MDENENDSSKRKNEVPLDSFGHAQKKTKTEDASSSSSMDSPSQTENLLQSPSHDMFMDNDFSYHLIEKDDTRLLDSLHGLRFLLRQGLEIDGDDESEESLFRGNFIELIKTFNQVNEDFDNVKSIDALKTNQFITPSIRRDLINSCSEETTKAIVRDIGGDYFAILVDGYYDISGKPQMAMCLRYVDKEGDVIERFLGVVEVTDSKAFSHKDVILVFSHKYDIFSFLAKHLLSPSNIRGLSYNGSNIMNCNINGLKNSIMVETQSAFYNHRFAHQLQPTLFAISKTNGDCNWMFDILTKLVNVIVISWKGNEMSEESRFLKVTKAFEDFEMSISKTWNKKLGSGRPKDTCFGAHYKLILNIIADFSMIIEMLDMIMHCSSSTDDRSKANYCYQMESFDFVFVAHVMKTILGVTKELNIALMKNDQDIVNAMSLVKLAKERLQILRDDGWEPLLSSVISFCDKNDIEVLNMEDAYIPRGRPSGELTNLQHFKGEVFYAIIDLQLKELNNRFDKINMELLECMSRLSPIDAFCSFDKQKLLRLAEFYPKEFSSVDLLHLDDQLDNYIYDIKNDDRFKGLKDVKKLSKKLVKTKKHEVYNHVYLLIKLMLILPVAKASVERGYSTMAYVESKLSNSVGDEYLNNRMVTYLEADVFTKISNDKILSSFQSKGMFDYTGMEPPTEWFL